MERQLERQSYEMAEAHRQKDAFLAMLAHELRNPLSPIFNALHLLGLEKGENQLQREARSVIDRQVRHLARLVDDLLEVARVTTGRIRLRLEKVELNALVEHSVEAVRSMINRKKQTIDVTLHPSVLWLNADATRLEQIVGNILTNASKYTAVGGNVRVTVEQDRHHAVIRVADNGAGIPLDLLPRIFDLFTQADHSLARSEGGLGIGLALVKSLVELHRGTVTAASGGLGQGSEFAVRVPLASAFSSDEVTPDAQLALKTDSLRILVVDDGEDAAKMAALLLRASGHDIRIAHAGHAALEIAADFKPQVVLLDIGLPEMDGYEVARRLRQLPQTKNTLLVAVTGYGQDSDRRRSKEAGFDHHLLKPVQYNKLSKLLSEVDVGQS
jgi:CheY-like chemotaxis protein